MKKFNRLPNHIAFIPDGNGRWAEQRNLPRIEGHRAGIESTRSLVRYLSEYRIKYVTLYSFSTENWNRPRAEVNSLLKILSESIENEAAELHQNGVRVRHIGRLNKLPQHLKQSIEGAVELTRDNAGMNLNLAFDYGGRTEIVDAVRSIVSKGIPSHDIDEGLFSSHLYTADMPYVDLLVRTGGELRISNFLLWQSAYSELYFTKVLWPDFDIGEIEKALAAYSRRQRRFGRV
ncbi:MAG TPA: di-trans,poly-cis-decaprenylcistransferase [Dehalococcoidia bacterium]|nr:di-trans,poly-cis-decaprenylcistransferase [Dehalococcoidia bacterium]